MTPGLKYFREQLLRRFEPRPEHKTTRQRMKYVDEVVEAVFRFDDVVLFETADCNWNSEIIPTVKVWVIVCERHQRWVNAMNRDLETLGLELNLDPFYADPDPSRTKPDMWWP